MLRHAGSVACPCISEPIEVIRIVKSQGKRYQSRINAILRREMISSIK